MLAKVNERGISAAGVKRCKPVLVPHGMGATHELPTPAAEVPAVRCRDSRVDRNSVLGFAFRLRSLGLCRGFGGRGGSGSASLGRSSLGLLALRGPFALRFFVTGVVRLHELDERHLGGVALALL